MTNNPPKHLRPATAKWYRRVLEDFDLEEHHRRILLCACESWDRCEAARLALAKHGMTFDDRFGQPHARPEIGIERDARLAFVRCLRELGLDVTEPNENRPPVMHGNHRLRMESR